METSILLLPLIVTCSLDDGGEVPKSNGMVVDLIPCVKLLVMSFLNTLFPKIKLN